MIDVELDDTRTIAGYLGLLDSTTMFMDMAGQNIRGSDFDNPTVRKLRQDLLSEEGFEYYNAEDEDNLVEVVDGLLDIIVIAWGSLLAYVGEEKAREAAIEVARSNLDKVVGDGLPIFREDGKVLKPKGWLPPNIAAAIA